MTAAGEDGTRPVAMPAATLVLFRPRAAGAPEILLVERAGKMAFAGGAMVFPGGRVDPGDRVLAARLGADLELDDTAARVAAIRETIEEAGIPIGISGTIDPASLRAARAALHDGGALAEQAAAHGWTIDPSALVPFSRWLPHLKVTRTFDTRFYAAEVPADTVADPDGGECVRALWITAADALAEAAAGRIRIIFPTRRNLERIAAHDSFASFAADAARRPAITISPWVESRDGTDWLCIPEDAGYPITAELAAPALRT